MWQRKVLFLYLMYWGHHSRVFGVVNAIAFELQNVDLVVIVAPHVGGDPPQLVGDWDGGEF